MEQHLGQRVFPARCQHAFVAGGGKQFFNGAAVGATDEQIHVTARAQGWLRIVRVGQLLSLEDQNRQIEGGEAFQHLSQRFVPDHFLRRQFLARGSRPRPGGLGQGIAPTPGQQGQQAVIVQGLQRRLVGQLSHLGAPAGAPAGAHLGARPQSHGRAHGRAHARVYRAWAQIPPDRAL